MSRELLVLFSSLGVLNGFFLVIYFFFLSKEKSRSENMLGFLFLVITVRIGKSVLFYFTELNETVIHIGLVASSMIGPFLYLYFASVFEKKDRLARIGLFHLLPSLALFIFSFYIGYRDQNDIWQMLIRWIRRIWFIYIALAGIYIYQSRESNIWRQQRFWLISVFISVFAVWLAYMTNDYTSYIVGALTFTVLIYFLMLVIFVRFRGPKKKTRKSSDFIIPDDPFYQKLHDYLTTTSIFKDADITMPNIAKALNVTPHYLSQFINESMQTNFPKLINHYRIEEAIRLIKEGTQLSMEALALECGFNSSTTFYSSFKSITGFTPATFKERLDSSNL